MHERYQTLLRQLVVLDERAITAALPMPVGATHRLDARTTALVRLAGIVALQSLPSR